MPGVLASHDLSGNSPEARKRRRGLPAATWFLAGAIAVISLAVVHLTQGTSGLGPGDLLATLFGTAEPERAQQVQAVVVGARLPRLVVGILIGALLGMSGVALQALARNPLASPDTLAVNAGAQLAVVGLASAGLSLSALPSGAAAFLGGLLAAVVTLALGGRGSASRLVLAGTALTIAISSVVSTLQILFQEETSALFAWGNGSLLQIDLNTAIRLLPAMLTGAAGLIFLSRPLDLMSAGDDVAASLGVRVGQIRIIVLIASVLLSSAAVTLAGPVGFVGLFAPATVRMLAGHSPSLLRHRVRYPVAALLGAAAVVGADVLLRALFGAQAGANVPTGVVTTLLGAVVLVAVARRMSAGTDAPSAGMVAAGSTRRFVIVLTVSVVVTLGCAVAALMLGGRLVLLGDFVNWLRGVASWSLDLTFSERLPRVLAALLAGAALAVAGTTVQAVCRNPLAEPGLLGVSSGAGVAAVATVTLFPQTPLPWVITASLVGALAAFGAVLALARSRSGRLDSGRMVLIGIGVSAVGAGLISMMLALTDPWNKVRAMTWLAGSTYGRGFAEILPVAAALVIILPLVLADHRRLDLLSVDDDTPSSLGVAVPVARRLHLAAAAVLTAFAVSAIGVISFVGLVAPHCARALVGAAHRHIVPIAALIGALLVSVGDTLGRTVIHPAQLPAGLVAAVIGAPYFIYLLWRMRD